MKKYYMYNFIETEELYIGDFNSDDEFWAYYWANEHDIIERQFKLDNDCKIWHMANF